MKTIRFLVLAGFMSAVFGDVSGAEYKYVNYSAPDSFEGGKVEFILDVSAKEIRSSDVIDAVSVCKDGDDLYCFGTGWINFSVPKGEIEIGRKWEHGQIEFEVMRRELFKVLGVTKHVWVIKKNRSDRLKRRQIFYYSEENGLLAIKDVGCNDEEIQFFVIVGSKGFPR